VKPSGATLAINDVAVTEITTWADTVITFKVPTKAKSGTLTLSLRPDPGYTMTKDVTVASDRIFLIEYDHTVTIDSSRGGVFTMGTYHVTLTSPDGFSYSDGGALLLPYGVSSATVNYSGSLSPTASLDNGTDYVTISDSWLEFCYDACTIGTTKTYDNPFTVSISNDISVVSWDTLIEYEECVYDEQTGKTTCAWYRTLGTPIPWLYRGE
jgi:hypothetical protein